jgi:predicted nucleotidyltransferase
MFEKLKSRWGRIAQGKKINAQKRLEYMKLLLPIFKKYNVKVAYLFGSTVKKSCDSESDIDIYVEGVEDKLYWEIRRELEGSSPYPIDVYTQSDDEQFIKKIKERGIKIYESKD